MWKTNYCQSERQCCALYQNIRNSVDFTRHSTILWQQNGLYVFIVIMRYTLECVCAVLPFVIIYKHQYIKCVELSYRGHGNCPLAVNSSLNYHCNHPIGHLICVKFFVMR